MTLYRIVHKDIARKLYSQPQAGYSFLHRYPFLYAYNSLGVALIEHPLYANLARNADAFRLVQYSLPDESLYTVDEPREIYQPGAGLRVLGHWAENFLQKGAELIAEFPSRHWKGVMNHIINPKHPLFDQVEVQEIRLIR